MQPIIMNSKRNSKRNSNKTNILQQPVNYDTVNPEMQPIIMNSTKNENTSKTDVTNLSHKPKSIIILKQKHKLFQKLTKEEEVCENILNYWLHQNSDVKNGNTPK